MNIPSQTILELARHADIAVSDAENALHRAEQRLAKAKELQAITNALYVASLEESAKEALARIAKRFDKDGKLTIEGYAEVAMNRKS